LIFPISLPIRRDINLPREVIFANLLVIFPVNLAPLLSPFCFEASFGAAPVWFTSSPHGNSDVTPGTQLAYSLTVFASPNREPDCFYPSSMRAHDSDFSPTSAASLSQSLPRQPFKIIIFAMLRGQLVPLFLFLIMKVVPSSSLPLAKTLGE